MAVNSERISHILESLVLPQDNDPLRYNNDASSQPTACKTLTQDFKLNWNDATTSKVLPSTDTMVFVFRHPTRAVITYDNNASSQPFAYAVYDYAGTTSQYVPPGCINFPFNSGPARSTTGYAPHGPVLYPALEDGRVGYWCDSDGSGKYSSLMVTAEGDTSALLTGSVSFWFWSGAAWILQETVSMENGVATYGGPVTPKGGAYSHVTISTPVNCSATQFNLQIQTGGVDGPSVWCHHPVSNLDQLLPIMQGARVLAASVDWENFGSDLEESGKVVAVGVAAGQNWTKIGTSQSALTQLSGYKPGLAKKGYYGFLRIDDEQDLVFRQDVGTGALPDSQPYAYFPLRERSSYLAISMSIASTTSRDTSITVTHSLEYLTNSKIQETRPPYVPGISGYTYTEWSVAIQKLSELPQHHESKVSWRKIVEQLSNKRARV